MSDHLELYRSGLRSKKWRWRYVAENGNILADSGQGYSRRIDMEAAISRVLGGVWDGPDFWRDTRVEGADDIRVVEVER